MFVFIIKVHSFFSQLLSTPALTLASSLSINFFSLLF